MQSCIFPQELVDYILDFLYDDPNTLKNCSLVYRAWIPTCRIHIFRRVCFPYRGSAACRRFYGLLEDVPSIIPLVQGLQILSGRYMWEMGRVGEIDPWLSTEKTLPRVLTTLQSAGNLKAFSIMPMDDWAALPLNLRTTVRALLQLPSLTEVNLTDCNFGFIWNLDALLGHCPGLKRVKLSQITFRHRHHANRTEENFSRAQHSDRTRIECLTALGIHGIMIIDWVLRPRAAVDVTSLRKLRCSIYPWEFSPLKRFLEMGGSSLDHLHLEMASGSFASAFHGIDVNHHHLRSLRLSFDMESDPDQLLWVTNFFSQIKSDGIREIVVDLRFPVQIPDWSREVFILLRWNDLDITLNRTPFNLLKRVDVTISWETDETKPTWLVDDVKGLLPRLASKVYELVYEDYWLYDSPSPTWHTSS